VGRERNRGVGHKTGEKGKRKEKWVKKLRRENCREFLQQNGAKNEGQNFSGKEGVASARQVVERKGEFNDP